MSVRDSFEAIFERLQRNASVESVYGEPIEAGDRTVVPVAKVAYGFGWGSGSSGSETADDSNPDAEAEDGSGSGEGAGGGGGVSATPVGALEITDYGTKFVRFDDTERVVLAVLLGVAIGLVFGRRRE